MLLVGVNGALVFYLRFFHNGHLASGVPVGHYAGFLAVYAALVGIFSHSRGLYRPIRHLAAPLDESLCVLMAVFWATVFLIAFIYLSGDKWFSRLVIGSSGVLNAITLPAWRFWRCEIMKHRVASGCDGRSVLIIGAGKVGQALAAYFEQNKHLGYVVKGFLDLNGNGNPKIIGRPSDLTRLAMAHFVDEVFVTTPSERDLVAHVLLQARQRRFAVNVIPDLFDGLGWRAPIGHIGDFPVMELLREPIPAFGLFAKRLVDIVGATVGLVALSPLVALIAAAIKLDSRGPIFYRSRRVGKKHRLFTCYKLRTMVVNAEALKPQLRHLNERSGPLFKIENDPRATRVGRWLRKYSLDELPQLWNVLRGDMSLVGPRPPVPEECAEYRLEYLRRLDVKPGVTGLWQVTARSHPSFETALGLDLEYIENWNFWLDIKLLLKTVPVILRGSGT